MSIGKMKKVVKNGIILVTSERVFTDRNVLDRWAEYKIIKIRETKRKRDDKSVE